VIVCSCHVVRAEEIRSEVRLGATTVDEVADRCGAGSRCGGCRRAVECLIADEVDGTVRAVGIGTRR
jgi:bacterioferritin-associated ferredoxin